MWFLERLGFHTSQDELKLLVGKPTLDYIEFHFFYDILIKREKNSSSPSSSSSSSSFSNDDIGMEKDLEEAFRVFDLNGDGFISSEELQSALLRLGLWDEQSTRGLDCKCMISLYDTNSDGMLDFQEFRNMMLLTS
ncbi:hypothetical protein Leryth_008990 [Lithospermum erythrorhizon]|nr:hypothetical protein Leryth_008990 [Lithospermum erythrorhizon]